MTQTLYIDGQLVDIDEHLAVSLNIKSNLLGDVSKIAANHTYTLQLPATAHNRALIENADTIPVSTQFPYMFHRADYYRDGLPIIEDGRAVLLSVGETIDIVLTWGVSTPLSQFITNGATLNDLQTGEVIAYSETPTFQTWGTFIADAYYSPFYARADYHKPLDNGDHEATATENGWNASYVRPVVRVPWILDYITSQYGVTFQWEQEAQDVLDRLCLPLVKDKPNAATLDSATLTTGEWSREGVSSAIYELSVDNTGGVFSSYDTNYAYVGTTKTITLGFDITISSINYALATMLAENSWIQIRVYNGTDYEDSESLQMRFDLTERSGDVASVECKGTLDVALQSGQGVAIMFVTEGLATFIYHNVNAISGQTITATNQADHVQFGSDYPIDGNLGDIKIVDFLKTLCAICGVFPKQPKGNVIEFVPFSELAAQANNAYDWTRKVIPSYELERPRNTEYRVSEWAQRNWLRWKELDDYDGQDDGSVNVSDLTLDAERDLFTLPFAPCRCNSMGRARVPVWELNNYDKLITEEETTPTYDIDDAEPRLLMATPQRSRRYINTGDQSGLAVMLTMDGLRFGEIIGDRYTTLSTMMSEARVITERVRLTDADLLSFDETIPVYLAQYGNVFAVLEINADTDGTAEVKMIKI